MEKTTTLAQSANAILARISSIQCACKCIREAAAQRNKVTCEDISFAMELLDKEFDSILSDLADTVIDPLGDM